MTLKLRVLALVVTAAPAAAQPALEVAKPSVKVDVPAVPAFEVTGADLEGAHSVKELRFAGTKLLDTTVAVRGVVTWVYSCPKIDVDPTECERPKFYVGDDANTPKDQSLWVVDVPRPYNKLEMRVMKKADRTMPDRCEPGDKKQRVCPSVKVGDVVTVIGDFKLASPHSERNSDGLLVFKALQDGAWETAGQTWPTKKITPAAIAPARPARPNLTVPKVTPTSAGDADALDWYNRGREFEKAGDWAKAADAFAHCTKLRPDAAMYQMWHGVALYEEIVASAREDLARKTGHSANQVRPDLSAVVFDEPLAHLALAVKIAPGLWRAHYYLGRIDRDHGAAKAAAEDFTAAIQAFPRFPAPYIALTEIYRRWDYLDQAIQIAAQGAANTNDADVWFALGMAYFDKRMDDRAIEAFTKASNHPGALFERGVTYARRGDKANAKRDLEAFVKLNAPGLEFQRQVASQMLMDLAR